ncbi:MAG: alpha/beta fold hydrolase, partial [bacterium]
TPFGWRVWENFMERNAHRYTMYAITPPGYSGTPPWPMPTALRPDGVPDYGAREWSNAVVEAIAELILREKLDRPLALSHHLIADSYALQLGLEHADKIRGIVVAAGSPGWRVPSTLASRDQWVHDNRVPFFRRVSPETWRANTFPASRLTRDSSYGRALVQEQRSVPLPTQIRYFLEFLASDFGSKIRHLQVPLLVLDPAEPFDSLSAPMRAAFIGRAGGDTNAARSSYNPSWQWRAAGTPVVFRALAIPNSGIFLMHDQPAEFAAAIQEFAARLR